MKLIGAVIIISILLESIASQLIVTNTFLLLPLFTIVSLIIIYPYFNNNNQSFLLVSGATGLLYDIVFTNAMFLNGLVFLVLGFIVIITNESLSNNKLNVLIMTALTIVAYRIVTYLTLLLVDYKVFNFNELTSSITSSILLNLIYSFILFCTANYISKKYHILKID